MENYRLFFRLAFDFRIIKQELRFLVILSCNAKGVYVVIYVISQKPSGVDPILLAPDWALMRLNKGLALDWPPSKSTS